MEMQNKLLLIWSTKVMADSRSVINLLKGNLFAQLSNLNDKRMRKPISLIKTNLHLDTST